MNIAGMTERIVQAAVAQWAREVPYDLSVALGEIPAYQTYLGTTIFIERGKALLRNKKREIVEKFGQSEYDEVVRAFTELATAWEKIALAQQAVDKEWQNLADLKGKYFDLNKRVNDWS